MDEFYVIKLLKEVFNKKEEELNKTTETIHFIRSKLTDSNTSISDIKWLSKDLEVLDKNRRELRGQCSALRQAIAKLEKE